MYKRQAQSIEATDKLDDPSKMPVLPGDVEFKQLQGDGSGVANADIMDRILDRKTIRGVGAEPMHMGSNEFNAETSSRTQSIRDAILTEAYQKRVEKLINYALSRVLRNLGITDPAKLTLKRIDIVERDFEADVSQKMARSIRELVLSGMTPRTAVEFYAETTDISISEELLEKIEEEYNQIQQPRSNNAAAEI